MLCCLYRIFKSWTARTKSSASQDACEVLLEYSELIPLVGVKATPRAIFTPVTMYTRSRLHMDDIPGFSMRHSMAIRKYSWLGTNHVVSNAAASNVVSSSLAVDSLRRISRKASFHIPDRCQFLASCTRCLGSSSSLFRSQAFGQCQKGCIGLLGQPTSPASTELRMRGTGTMAMVLGWRFERGE